MDPTTVFTVAIISATITIVSLVLSIFGSSWLNQRSNERIIESLKSELKADNQSLRNEFKAEIQTLKVDFQNLRADVKTLDAKVDSIIERVARIERQLDQIFKPIIK